MIEHPQSYWMFSADPEPELSPLNGDVRTEVVIVGGGFTGLSTAHYLAKSGIESVLLEAQTPGWGASGRNGGFVSGRFRVSFPAMERGYGREVALRMYRVGRDAVENVRGLVEELGLESCNLQPYGGITGAYSEHSLNGLRTTVEWLRDRAGDDSTSLLSSTQIAEDTGSTRFIGGVLSTGSHGVHPLNLVRGIARSLVERGVSLHVESPVLHFRNEGDGVRVETPCGSVSGRTLVIATNAYNATTRAAPSLTRRVIPFRSALIATEPLPPALLECILPSHRLLADAKRVLRYCRVVDNRLLFGGRGAFDGQDAALAYGRLQRNMLQMFPALSGVSIEFRWSGLVGMTLDYLPHIGRLNERVLFAMGFNGTGVALTTLMGRYLARLVQNEPVDTALLAGERFPRIPGYALRAPVIRIAAGWYELLDSMGR